MKEPLNILVTGSQGRMGMAVIDCCNNDSQVNVSGGIDVGDSIGENIHGCDVIIDFSTHKITNDLHSASIERGDWQDGKSFSLLQHPITCLLYTSTRPRDKMQSRKPSSA